MNDSPLMSGKALFTLRVAVFLCGALVMIYEITGTRIVSPFIGTSTYVWTSLIGVILASLSLGYWLGGRFADKRPDVKILASVLLLSGGMVSLTILTKDIILSMVASMPTGLEIKSIVAALLLFAPASILLGFVTPYTVKLNMRTLADSGKTVGSLYALSTIGSILGTFAAGFLLIPFVGSSRTLYLIAGTLFLLSFLLAPFVLTTKNIAILVLFVVGISASELQSSVYSASFDVHDIDTEYSRIRVFKTTDPHTNRAIQAMATDPYFIQSGIFLDSDEIVFDYNRYYELIRHFKPDHKRVMMIGGAGYTFPKDYLRTHPEGQIEVIEIDPQMTEIARKYFRLKDDPRLNIAHEDGRVYLNRTVSATYDAVLMDAFGSLFSVPYQLTTLEAVQNMDRVLTENGVVIFNLGSAIQGKGSRFLDAELATYRRIFPQVYLFKVNAEYPDERTQNLIIIASKSTTPIPMQSPDPYLNNLFAHLYTKEIPTQTPILSDDLAPVEYYNSFAQNLIETAR